MASHTISTEAGSSAGHLEGCPAVDTGSFHPVRLAGRIIRHFVLEEDVRAATPVPDHLVFLIVINEKPVRSRIVPIDDNAVISSVVGPTDPVAMVGAPRPNVV